MDLNALIRAIHAVNSEPNNRLLSYMLGADRWERIQRRAVAGACLDLNLATPTTAEWDVAMTVVATMG
jgi:hypothetical protein